ncbi:MAG: hypothetical protein DSZ06_00510 [Sulfurospirillum sp.]|nr:MAG: hypothetical protein DSZ06_00510 [Sulfurospirillum sp.]
MFKSKNIPIYFLFFLLILIFALQIWTYYLGKPTPTFERYVIKPKPEIIKKLSIRRYKAPHSPHLFTIKVDKGDEEKLVNLISKSQNMKKIDVTSLPDFLSKVDKEMVDVVKKSPYIYVSKKYDTQNYKNGRFRLLFSDKNSTYLYLNGDL